VWDGRHTFAAGNSRQDQLNDYHRKLTAFRTSQENKDSIEDFDVAKLYEQVTFGEDDVSLIDEGYTTQFISEDKLKECPSVKITIGGEEVLAILDTGSELSLMNQELYSKLRDKGMNNLELPVQNINLVSAFSDKSRKVKRQAMISLNFGELSVDQIFLISSGLMTEVLLGVDFCVENKVKISFPERCFTMEIDNHVSRQVFYQKTDKLASSVNKLGTGHLNNSDVRLTSVTFRSSVGAEELTDKKVIQFQDKEGGREVSLVREPRGCSSWYVQGCEGSYCCITCGNIKSSLMEYEQIRNSLPQTSNVDVLKGHNLKTDDREPMGRETTQRNKPNNRCFAARSNGIRTNDTTQDGMQNLNLSDSRDVTQEQLRAKVNEGGNLSESQKEKLHSLLCEYKSQLTTRPGRCNKFEYKFQMTGEMPKSRSTRPIPFALRAQVREQINEMLEDKILERSYSDYVNPLTLVEKPGGGIRICIDARRVNAVMVPDRVKVDPMKELLQRFHGSKFFTTLDLCTAFLQVPLHEDSRRWTSFQFGNQVFQYRVVPYGFKNSLAAFIRALDMVLGDSIGGYVVTYVDDLVVHSATFEDHLMHLDTVLQKFATAGFTINANKCSFCKPQIKFLGHVISSEALLPDEDRVKAILSYPPPRNQKQLRRFLGICNFHHQFIPNNAHFVSPLLILLKKGQKWKWNDDLQKAFEELRGRFANSIRLVHPDSEADYIINTDASAKAIGGVLMQEGKNGELRIISTTSRVLTANEQRFSTCEQELLAIVHALQKFRIYVYGRKIKLYTDNQALTFLNRCAITSNRVTRWMLAIQQYDVEISHIKGTKNVLADVLIRNPSELTQEETRELRRPETIMVHAINRKVDNSVGKALKDLGKLQDTDPRLKEIRDKIGGHTSYPKEKFTLKDNVLFCTGMVRRGGKPCCHCV
jgi:hypothetical protein